MTTWQRYLTDATNQTEKHRIIAGQRVAGTCEWLSKNHDFEHWLDEEHAVLAILGPPGYGKTIICSWIIDHLRSKWDNDKSTAVLYFYFSHSMASEASDTNLVSSMVSQLLGQIDERHWPRVDPKSLDGPPSFEILVRMFTALLGCLRQTFIVIDAVDECYSNNRRLLAFLGQLIRDDTTDKHILLSSRHDPDLTPLIRSTDSLSLILDWRNQKEDIRLFTQKKVQLASWNDWLSKDEVEKITKVVSDHSDTILWATLAVRNLDEASSRKEFWQRLEELEVPSSLDSMWEHLLHQTLRPAGPRSRPGWVLRWVDHSPRPLRVEEVAEVFALDLDAERILSENQRLAEPRSVVETLKPLLSTRTAEVDGATFKGVFLTHPSLSMYLRSTAQPRDPNSEISEACLRYLGMLAHSQDQPLTQDIHNLYPLAGYAARYWPHHMREAYSRDRQSTDQLTHIAMEFLQDPSGKFLRNWISCFDPDRSWITPPKPNTVLPRVATPLYYASTLGLEALVRKLLEGGADLDAVCGTHGTALQAAAYRGHREIVRLLLAHGANPSTRGGLHGTALNAAKFVGHLEIFELLRERQRASAEQPGVPGRYESELPRHIVLSRQDDDPYEFRQPLGEGGKGYVDEVQSLAAGFVCVRKTLFQSVTSDGDRQVFANEVLTMEKLSHVHIVKVLGSYTTELRWFHILMEPVADRNLAKYLDDGAADARLLRRWLGCIANGLAYIHGQRVKHKDIKPSNLLVRGDNILYSDFGLAHLVESLDDVTRGQTPASWPYSAPEVVDGGDRTVATDVFSLGCVYTEMLTVMTGEKVGSMKSALGQGRGGEKFSFRGPPAQRWLTDLADREDSYPALIDITKQMLSYQPTDRPSAAKLAEDVGWLGCSLCQRV